MGADKILTAFRNAEEEMKRVQEDAKTFFIKKARTEDKKEKLNYSFTKDNYDKISLSDCEEQLRDWAKELVDREIERRPEGAKLKDLKVVNDYRNFNHTCDFYRYFIVEKISNFLK